MSKLSTAINLLLKNRGEFMASLLKQFAFLLPDKFYLSKMFYFRMGYNINWSNPQTYSEKLQWLKIYDHNPLYTKLVDKYEVKEYVSKLIGKEYLAKTYGVWENPNDIDFSKLPEKFVLKTTHGGGNDGVFICKEKNKLDIIDIRRKLTVALKQDLYKDSREWPYKNVPKRILAEEFLEDTETRELRDYKFFCFNGEVKALFVATERQTRKEPYFNFFDESYNCLNLQQGHPVSANLPQKPISFDKMKEIASVLSNNLPHVRVDLYEANGKIFFGELTFYHFGGMVPFNPPIWDKIFGDWLDLQCVKS